MRRAAILLGVVVVACSYGFALNPSLDVNQYAHRSWKVREGFFRGLINTIRQTPDGYLWVGTEFGLYRFDGVRSVQWQPRSGESLPSNVIRHLFVSTDGTLWIGTLKGPASWKNSKLTLYPSLYGEEADSFAEDRDATIWVGVESAPAWRLCAIRKGTVQCFGDNGALGLGVGCLLTDIKGNLWAGTGTRLWRLSSGSPESIPLTGPAPSEIHNLINDEAGAILISTRDGIVRFANGRISTYRLPDYAQQINPYGLLRDREGSIWIGTKDRALLHVHQGSVDHYGIADGLSSDFIQDLLEDREGNIWIATASGLDCFHGSGVSPMSLKDGVSPAGVESILTAADGSIWLGTRNGLYRWQHGQFTLYRKKRSQRPSTVPQIIDSGLPDDLHPSLFEDHRGQIWVFSRSGAAFLDKSGHFKSVPHLPGGFAHAIAEDSARDLWISQDQGFFHLLHGGKVEQTPWGTFGSRGVALAIASEPSGGGLWIGFSRGGVAYFREGQIRNWYSAAEGLGEGHVYKLERDPDGAVWAATEGGLSRLNSGLIHTLSTQNGLPCNTVHEFVKDDDHSLWLHTVCGLVRITRSDLEAWTGDPKLKIHATLFDASDNFMPFGLPGGLTPRMGKTADGKVWLISRDGVNVVDPHHLPPANKIPPLVHIEQIKADGKTYLPANGLRLAAHLRDLSIDYTALSLVAPEKVRFKYRLEGQDPDWKEVVNDRRVQYSNLPPRSYRFSVIACNNSGVWNEVGDTLDFSIDPAYYQTKWFRAVCVGLSLAMMWAAYRLRVRVLENRQRVLERHQGEITALNERLMKVQEEERIRIAGELHDGFLQQLTSLTLRMGGVALRLPADSEAKTRIKDLQAQMMQMGTELRHLSHELHPAALHDAGLPAALRAYCEEFSKVRGVPVFCEVDETIAELSHGAALVLYRIAQEALGNVAKHSQAKHAEVRLSRRDGNVQLFVSDDGIGFEPSDKTRTGLGLINMRERVHQLNGTFEFDSKPGVGTTVRATVPFRANS